MSENISFLAGKHISIMKCLIFQSFITAVSYTHLDVYKRQVYIYTSMTKAVPHRLYECATLPSLTSSQYFDKKHCWEY